MGKGRCRSLRIDVDGGLNEGGLREGRAIGDGDGGKKKKDWSGESERQILQALGRGDCETIIAIGTIFILDATAGRRAEDGGWMLPIALRIVKGRAAALLCERLVSRGRACVCDRYGNR